MKKTALCLAILAFIPLIAASSKDALRPDSYDPNARTNPFASSGPVQVDDGRALGDILMTIDLAAIGMPGTGYDNGGLSWDGQYLYLDNMYDNRIYIIDPTGPSLVGNFAAPPTLSWGLGHEQNLWITETNVFNAYEYTYAGSPTGNSFYCLQGGATWMGDASEWWPDGEIWILAVGGTNRLYKFAVPSGAYLADIGDATWTGISQRGVTYDPFNDKFWVGGWNSNMVWEINSTDGSPTGRSFPFTSIASLAYDWQSTLHNGPVLWVATNAPQDYIYMVDPDNPQPAQGWDFETGLQGWTHTNGQAFPAGWDVEPSGTHAAQTPPDAGDSTMWVDSDAGGNGFWIQDSALSPVCVPGSGMDWLKYGFCNYGGSSGYVNELHVGIKHSTGGVWTATELAFYPSGVTTGPAWDSADVSAYASADFVQVYFYFDDLDTWGYWAAFDNVLINAAVAEHDVGCNAIASPPAGNMIPAANYDVIGNIRNFGDFDETFDATAEVWDTTTWTQVFTQTVTLTAFAAGAESLVTFGNVTLAEDVVYQTMIYTELMDANPGNDTAMIYTNTTAFDFIWTFEDGTPQGWTHTNGQTFPMGFGIQPSGLHSTITPPDAGAYCGWWDSDAGGSAFWIQDTALSIPIAPNTSTAWLKWGFGNYSTGGSYLNELHVGIKHFTGGTPTAVELAMYPSSVQSGPAWDSADVSAYNTADSLQIYFYFDDLNTWGWYAAFDNVMINGDSTGTGIAGGTVGDKPLAFGFAPAMATMTKDHVPISYTITAPSAVSLKVYDGAGRLIRTLVDGRQPAGEKSLVWNTKDVNNRTIANGVYFLKLEAEGKIDIHKMILVK